MKTDVVIGACLCDGCGKRGGEDEEMMQVQVALRLYFSCNKCWPKMRVLFQTGRIK